MEDLYPTRLEEEKILERKDPVFFGDKTSNVPYGLKPDEVGYYEQNGFLLFPEFFSEEETQQLYQEYAALVNLESEIREEEYICEPNSKLPRSIFNPQRYSLLLEKLSRDPRILQKAEQILGGGVYIHHGRINIKRPMNGKSFPWHSDFETWHAEDGMPRMRAVTAWVMLTDNNEFNGPLYLIPGSHKKFVACRGRTPGSHYKDSLRKQEYGVPSVNALNELTRESTVESKLAGAYGKAGTLVFHESNIMHGSPDNISPWPRTNLFFVYNSVHNAPAQQPFAARNFRPEFLSNTEREPLVAEPV